MGDDDQSVGHDTKGYVCSHLLHRTRPVLLVVHEDDGDWVAACGQGDHNQSADSWFVVGFGHVPEDDPSVREVLDLPPGNQAERQSIGGEWVRRPNDDDDDQ